MMTHHAFVCWALTAPMIVPVLAFPLLRVERDPFDSIAQLLVGSLVVGLVPYLVFAAAFASWARERPPAQVERAAWLAPLLFVVPFATFWVLLVAVRGGTGALPMVMGLSGFAVGLGYAYVLAADVLYHLLARRGVIRPGPA